MKGDLEQLAGERLVVHNFTYDGRGPGGSTFFYAVNSSAVYSPADVARGYQGSRGFKLILPFPYQVMLSGGPDRLSLVKHTLKTQFGSIFFLFFLLFSPQRLY